MRRKRQKADGPYPRGTTAKLPEALHHQDATYWAAVAPSTPAMALPAAAVVCATRMPQRGGAPGQRRARNHPSPRCTLRSRGRHVDWSTHAYVSSTPRASERAFDISCRLDPKGRQSGRRSYCNGASSTRLCRRSTTLLARLFMSFECHPARRERGSTSRQTSTPRGEQ